MTEKTGAVVVGVDGSDGSLNAARWAAAVAARLETSLHIVHAMPSVGRNMTDAVAAVRAAMMSYQRDYAEIIIRSAEDAVRSQYPELAMTTLSTNIPVDEVLIKAGTTARMIVIGGSSVTPAGALFLGSTTLAVATHAACPVVAWRGANVSPTDGPVVVGVDEALSAAGAVETAFDFADQFGLKVSAVRSWPMRRPAAAVTIPFLVDWDALEAAEWTQLTNVVDHFNQAHPSVDATCFVETTGPTAALLHQISVDGAQLVVVGSRGHSALTSAVIGSTALNLLHHSPVPVMVCRSSRQTTVPLCEL
jgi:nucleotide-binding universal stress UspA family protein